MKYRKLGRTGFEVSEVSLGTWQVGGKWGEQFDEKLADRIISEAIDHGVNFIDTADVYGDGESEAAVGRAVRARTERIYVATKCGRRISPHVNEGYTPEALTGYVEDSLRNLGMDTIDLIQLHCPPTEVFYRPEIFETFERLRDQGKIRNLGVSVEKVEEALKAIEYPNVASVQIIFNMFRHRPSELFFHEATKKDVGIIVRVPLASGLLTGKFSLDTRFGKQDHRSFNRQGEKFDKGETFAGVPYETGLKAVGQLQNALPTDASLAQYALRWILMFPEVSTIIPGASRPEQVRDNLAAAELPPLSEEQMEKVRSVYGQNIRPLVHHLW